MTLVRSIINIDEVNVTTTTDPGWSPANMANFAVIDTAVVANGGRETVFQRVAGDDIHPMTVRVGHYPQPTASRVNVSIKVSTYVRHLDTDVDLDEYLPCTATLAWSMPGSAVPDSADLFGLLTNLFSWVFPTDAGVFITGNLDSLKFGVTDIAVQSD